MKLNAQFVLLVAMLVALAVAFSPVPREQDEPIPGTGPILEPHPITLRLCAKEVIMRAVIDDGLSLLDAAALCREAYRLIPDPSGRNYLADDETADGAPMTEEEIFCRQVIVWVESRGHTATVDRVQAEFREWRRQGSGRLPDVAELVPSPADLPALARAEWLAMSRGQSRCRMPVAGGFKGRE